MGIGQRARNTASAKEVAKLMRGARLTQLPPESKYTLCHRDVRGFPEGFAQGDPSSNREAADRCLQACFRTHGQDGLQEFRPSDGAMCFTCARQKECHYGEEDCRCNLPLGADHEGRS